MASPPNDFSQLDNEALIQQVQRNLQGQTAFAELYRRHVQRVYRYFLAQVGNDQDAQDLTAQTFLAALEAIPRYQGKSVFSTWLFGIAYHHAMDYFRRNRAEVSLEAAEHLSDADPLPDEAVSQRLQVENVIHAMKHIAPERAEALALHSFGGLSVTEVAAVMQKNEAAVRMLIHRAIRDLQQRLSFSVQEPSYE